jgi:hypothetical protein
MPRSRACDSSLIQTGASAAFSNPQNVWGGLFVPRYALVVQKALVVSAVHQSTAFLTGYVIGERLGHGDAVFRAANAFMRSGEPFYEFCHPANMRPESVGIQPAGCQNRTDPLPKRRWRAGSGWWLGLIPDRGACAFPHRRSRVPISRSPILRRAR